MSGLPVLGSTETELPRHLLDVALAGVFPPGDAHLADPIPVGVPTTRAAQDVSRPVCVDRGDVVAFLDPHRVTCYPHAKGPTPVVVGAPSNTRTAEKGQAGVATRWPAG